MESFVLGLSLGAVLGGGLIGAAVWLLRPCDEERHIRSYHLVFVAVLALLFIGGTAEAQHCGGGYYNSNYSPSYGYGSTYSYSYPQSYSYNYVPTYEVKKKVVYQDVLFTRYVAAVPLLDLPTYSAYYAPSAAPPAAPGAPAAAAPATATAPATAAAPAGSACAETAKMTGKLIGLLEKMDARMERIENFKAAPERLSSPAPARRERPRDPPPPMPEPKDDEEAAGPTVAKPASFEVVVQRTNKAKCAMCHERGNESKGGDFVLSEPDGRIVRLTDGQLADLQTHVVSGTMPKLTAAAKKAGVTALTVEEAQAWMELTRRQRATARAEAKKSTTIE